MALAAIVGANGVNTYLFTYLEATSVNCSFILGVVLGVFDKGFVAVPLLMRKESGVSNSWRWEGEMVAWTGMHTGFFSGSDASNSVHLEKPSGMASNASGAISTIPPPDRFCSDFDLLELDSSAWIANPREPPDLPST